MGARGGLPELCSALTSERPHRAAAAPPPTTCRRSRRTLRAAGPPAPPPRQSTRDGMETAGRQGEPGQGDRQRRGRAERGGREAPPHKVPPETRAGRARAGAAGCGELPERGHGPTPRGVPWEGWRASCEDSVFSFYMGEAELHSWKRLKKPGEPGAGSGAEVDSCAEGVSYL